jgi:hypothetical protein
MSEKQDHPFPFFRSTSHALSAVLSAISILLLCIFPLCAADLRLNDQDCFEARASAFSFSTTRITVSSATKR